MATKAKFICNSVTKRASNTWSPEGKPGPDGFVYDALFYPVTGGSMDSGENKSFFASTPSGQIQIGTIRDDHFVPGKSYYVTFTEAD